MHTSLSSMSCMRHDRPPVAWTAQSTTMFFPSVLARRGLRYCWSRPKYRRLRRSDTATCERLPKGLVTRGHDPRSSSLLRRAYYFFRPQTYSDMVLLLQINLQLFTFRPHFGGSCRKARKAGKDRFQRPKHERDEGQTLLLALKWKCLNRPHLGKSP